MAMHPCSALAATVTPALAATAGCKPMKPRPASAPPPQEPAAETAKAPAADDSPDSRYQSKSTLGKARDAALRAKDRMDAYQQDVAKQADEVFKNP